MSSKKGLGKGLDALFDDNEMNVEAASGVKQMKLSEIEPNAAQPRKEFDDAALLSLSESIAEYGVLQPLLVRQIPGGRYQIIAGERRWRASRMAGLSEVPVLVLEKSESETLELALVENLQREDLNPLEESYGYLALIEEFHLTQDEVARKVGRSRPAVANALRLLSLPDEVKELLKNGELSTGHAKAILACGDAERMIKLARLVAERGLSVRETERLAKKAEETPKPKQLAIDYLADFERRLSSHFGRKVGIQQKGKRGKLTIEYADADDLDALLRALGYEDEE